MRGGLCKHGTLKGPVRLLSPVPGAWGAIVTIPPAKQEQGGLSATSADIGGRTSGLTHVRVRPKDFNNIFREFQFLIKQAYVRGNLTK